MSENAIMAKEKKTTADRHKPARMIRLKGSLASQLEKIVNENETNLTQEVNRIVREYLVKEGKWPPPATK